MGAHREKNNPEKINATHPVVGSKKDEIALAAFPLFLSQGYDRVSLNDLLKATGLSKGGLYHYFESKEDLFQYTVELIFLHELFSYNHSLTESKGTPKEKIARVFEISRQISGAMIEQIGGVEEGQFASYYKLIFAGISNFPALLKKMRQGYDTMAREIAGVIEKGQKDQYFHQREDARVLADSLISNIEGIMLYYSVSQSTPLNTLIDNAQKNWEKILECKRELNNEGENNEKK